MAGVTESGVPGRTAVGTEAVGGGDRAAPDRLVLIGFSGAGKTTVGRLVADRLGWTLADLDDRIADHYGADIPTVFRDHGEAGFRATERRLLTDALALPRSVIVTGGGAVAADDVWSPGLLADPGVLVVALDVRPETTLRRLRAQRDAAGEATTRPMLAGDDPLGRIVGLKAARQPSYDRADVTVVTDGADAGRVADDVAGLVALAAGTPGDAVEVRLDAGGASSRIVVGSGVLARAAEEIAATYPGARRVWLVSDANVGVRHGEPLAGALRGAGLRVEVRTVAPGEGSKSLATAGDLYGWLLGGGVERGDVVVALGGGVVGDLAGFVAATTLRGIGLVQIPTSLLAMVDSSVGGKTAVNHPAGKNLIGAFHQPPLVLVDPDLLATLPARELTSGWAEIVKHAVIQPSTPGGERADLWPWLERNATAALALRQPALSWLIARNVALKAAVVEADEREASLRQILNFGHTLGHGIEAAGYRHLHGEAVALGMRAAVRIGAATGTCDDATVARLDATLDRYGLPDRTEADPDRVLDLMRGDKKRTAGTQRWILPLTAGGVAIRSDVPEETVRAALLAVTGTGR